METEPMSVKIYEILDNLESALSDYDKTFISAGVAIIALDTFLEESTFRQEIQHGNVKWQEYRNTQKWALHRNSDNRPLHALSNDEKEEILPDVLKLAELITERVQQATANAKTR